LAIAAAVGIVLAAAACSAITGFDGLTPGSASDAALEGALDALASDATSVLDAGGAAVDAAGFCARAVGLTFCDDFDTPEDGGTLKSWDTTSLTSAGSIAIDTADFVSPPASLLATAPEGGIGGQSAVRKVFSGHPNVSVALDVRLETTDDEAYNSVAEIHLNPIPTGYQDYRVALIYTKGAMTLDVFSAGEAGVYEMSAPVAVDFTSWHRVRLELDTSPSPVANVTDDNGVLYATLPLRADGANAQGADVSVGLPYVKGNAIAWRVRVDNVAVVTSD
jgi:hypothetical protein